MRLKMLFPGSIASLAALLVVVLLSTVGGSPDQAHGQVPPATPNYRCFSFPGPPALSVVNLQTQFGVENNVVVGQLGTGGVLLCATAFKNGAGDPAVPPLRCEEIDGSSIAQSRDITTQYERELAVSITTPELLCVPASQVLTPPGGALGPVPPQPYYKCYQAPGKDPSDVVGTIATKFGVENNVSIGQGSLLCVPTLKNGGGTLAPPALRCFNASGAVPAIMVQVATQFFPPPNGELGAQPLGAGTLFCVPALKLTASVGGMAELPDERDPAPLATDDSSRLGAGGIVAVVIGSVAAAIALLSVTAAFMRRRATSR